MSIGKIWSRLLAALRWLGGGLLDVLYPPVGVGERARREPCAAWRGRPGNSDDAGLSLVLLFRKPSLWNRRFWRSSGASRSSGKPRASDELDRH